MTKRMTKAPKAALSTQRRSAKPVSLAATPTEWDRGPRTMAQDVRKVIEPVMEWDEAKQKEVPNPNRVKRARRIDLVEHYFRQDRIDARQMAAGKALAAAWEATQRSPEAIKKVQVDSTPDHGAIAAMQVDRIARFHAVRRLIPDGDWPVLESVCCHNASVAQVGYKGARFYLGLALMCDALNRLADRLGL